MGACVRKLNSRTGSYDVQQVPNDAENGKTSESTAEDDNREDPSPLKSHQLKRVKHGKGHPGALLTHRQHVEIKLYLKENFNNKNIPGSTHKRRYYPPGLPPAAEFIKRKIVVKAVEKGPEVLVQYIQTLRDIQFYTLVNYLRSYQGGNSRATVKVMTDIIATEIFAEWDELWTKCISGYCSDQDRYVYSDPELKVSAALSIFKAISRGCRDFPFLPNSDVTFIWGVIQVLFSLVDPLVLRHREGQKEYISDSVRQHCHSKDSEGYLSAVVDARDDFIARKRPSVKDLAQFDENLIDDVVAGVKLEFSDLVDKIVSSGQQGHTRKKHHQRQKRNAKSTSLAERLRRNTPSGSQDEGACASGNAPQSSLPLECALHYDQAHQQGKDEEIKLQGRRQRRGDRRFGKNEPDSATHQEDSTTTKEKND